ncbi:sugar ABC transporter substrate-binding protein [Streptosporangium sp. NBC_01639]|uniref:sugar ABC transporter substrate-binding protein n=1 Tax=Streptosporangium sp. NBC_01639 TaxID=2975948 RepID=UPI0038637586|nr:sugar ABC transporter substrate-binding protein [Streptosporangium sp. NBC_01639]
MHARRYVRYALNTAIITTLSAGVTACSNAIDTATGPAAAKSSATSLAKPIKSMLFVNPLPNYPAWKTIGQCMKAEAEKNGITFSQAGPNGNDMDTKLMIDRLQQGISSKIDALVTFPASAEQFDPVFAQARAAGAYVATVEGGQTKNQNINAGTSFEQFGQLAAKTVAAKPGQQNVAFLTQGPTGPDAIFVNAFKEAAKQYSSIKIVDTRYDSGDVTKTIDLATALMTAHPELNHFVTNEGAATPGIIAAIKQKSQVSKVFLTTNSIYSGSVEGMKAGIVYSFLLQNMCEIGRAPVDALIKLSKGETVPSNISTPIDFATASTVDSLTKSGDLQ